MKLLRVKFENEHPIVVHRNTKEAWHQTLCITKAHRHAIGVSSFWPRPAPSLPIPPHYAYRSHHLSLSLSLSLCHFISLALSLSLSLSSLSLSLCLSLPRSLSLSLSISLYIYLHPRSFYFAASPTFPLSISFVLGPCAPRCEHSCTSLANYRVPRPLPHHSHHPHFVSPKP